MDQELLWGTPASTSDQSGTCPFNKTLGFLFRRKSQRFSELSDIPFCFNFKMEPLWQTLPSTVNISTKIRLTSKSLSNALDISWVIAKCCFMQELSVLNLDLLGEKKFIFNKQLKHFIKNRFFKNFFTDWFSVTLSE